MKFEEEDIKRGWKVCEDCKERVFQLDACFDAQESICGKCNLYTVKKEDFFKNE